MTSRAKNKSIRNVKNDPNGRWMFSKLRSCVPDANNKRRHAAAHLLLFFFLNFKLILTLNEWKAQKYFRPRSLTLFISRGRWGEGGVRKRPDDDIPAANFGTIPKLRKVVRPPRRGRRRGTAASGYF